MKRWIALICLLVMLTSLCACDADSVDAPAPDPDYAIDENEAYEETKEPEEPEETELETMGVWTLETVKNMEGTTGFLIHYPDDSFDYYFGGTVINWGMPELYTYGTERSVSNLVMYIDDDKQNQEKLENGELVFITDKDTKVYAYFFPVIENGYAMIGKNADGVREFLLWTNEKGTKFDYVDGFTRTPERREIDTINGVYVGDEIIFEKDENNKYVTLKEGDIYTIGEANGTTLVENKYSVDCVYYLHTYNTGYKLHGYTDVAYSFELQPTTDGYARVDLSKLPAGDYVAMYSYWSEEYGKRNAYMAHIVID